MYIYICIYIHTSFPTGLDGKESTCNAGDLGLILGLGRSPGEGNGNSLQCSCLENPLHRGAWRFTFHGYNWATNTYMYTTSYPFVYHWALTLLLYLGYCKYKNDFKFKASKQKERATLVTEYRRIPVTVTGWFWISQHHILCSNKHNEVFVLYCATWQLALTLLLKYLWDGKWSQVWHGESELLLWLPDTQWCQERPSSDQPWSGMCSSLNVPEGADTTWENPLNWRADLAYSFYFPQPKRLEFLLCN